MSRPVAILLLLACTSLWGLAFLAQKTAMQHMGPLTFSGLRYLLGGLVVLPIAIWEVRRKAANTRLVFPAWLWGQVALLTLVFLIGSYLQQVGLLTTTITNGGFLTSLYVFFVPLIGFLIWRNKPHPILYLGVPLALVGIFYLNGGHLDHLNSGDGLVTVSAVFWAMHVLLLGKSARDTGLPIAVSCISFLGAGLVATLLAFPIEMPTLSGITDGWIEIAYAGIFSTGIAFTLQAVAQQYVPPANAAIVLSSESLFAALGGALVLDERLPPIGYAGAALIFFAIVMVETVPAWRSRRTIAPPPPDPEPGSA